MDEGDRGGRSAVTGPSMGDPGREEPDRLEVELPSGRVTLGFVREEPFIYLVGRDRSARWPTQLLRDGGATLWVAGSSVRGAAGLITDPTEKARVLDLFRARYGPTGFERWYAHPARVLRIRLGAAPHGVASEGDYHAWLEAEFDNVADDYDRHITGNRINRLLRDRSLQELRRSFHDAHRVLEVGCGSGMETLPLLEDGHEVVCVDISQRMLDVVREKAVRVGVGERLRTVHLAASDLPRLAREEGTASFDGAYSTYGALNCEGDLRPVAGAIAELVRPGAPFVAGVYNRWCAFELAGYGITGRWGRAVGRMRHVTPVGSSRFCVDVFALSAAEVRRVFEPWFTVVRTEGVPVLLPPSDLASYVERFGSGFSRLDRWDRALGRRWPFRLLGDHFLMTLRRDPDGRVGAS